MMTFIKAALAATALQGSGEPAKPVDLAAEPPSSSPPSSVDFSRPDPDRDSWAKLNLQTNQLAARSAALGVGPTRGTDATDVMEQLVHEGRVGDTAELQRRVELLGRASGIGPGRGRDVIDVLEQLTHEGRARDTEEHLRRLQLLENAANGELPKK